MSSSSLDPSFFSAEAEAATQPATDVVQELTDAQEQEQQHDEEDDVQRLLRDKDEEIKQLKQAIVFQHKEIKKLKAELSKKPPPMDLTTASIQGIANDSIPHLNHDTTKISKVDQRWKNRFQQLVAYKLAHGDCNVPQSYKDKSLHAWVRTQREAKKEFDKAGDNKKGCKMTQERIDALNSVGFQWVVGHQPNDAAWEEMFQALMQYKQQHGHTRVSSAENKQLYKWVLNQRARRRLLEANGEGKAKGMTWARVEKLSAIDFCWEASSNRRRTTEPAQWAL